MKEFWRAYGQPVVRQSTAHPADRRLLLKLCRLGIDLKRDKKRSIFARSPIVVTLRAFHKRSSAPPPPPRSSSTALGRRARSATFDSAVRRSKLGGRIDQWSLLYRRRCPTASRPPCRRRGPPDEISALSRSPAARSGVSVCPPNRPVVRSPRLKTLAGCIKALFGRSA